MFEEALEIYEDALGDCQPKLVADILRNLAKVHLDMVMARNGLLEKYILIKWYFVARETKARMIECVCFLLSFFRRGIPKKLLTIYEGLS